MSVVERGLSKLIDADRGMRKGREITDRQKQEISLSPYNPTNIGLHEHVEQDSGGDDGTRTHDPLLAKQVL